MITEEFVVGFFLTFTMGALTLGAIWHFFRRFSECTERVQAEVVDVIAGGSQYRNSYQPVYRYEYGWKEYQNNGFTGIIRWFPKTVSIRINPQNPDDFIDLPAMRRNGIILVPVLILMLITGIEGLMS